MTHNSKNNNNSNIYISNNNTDQVSTATQLARKYKKVYSVSMSQIHFNFYINNINDEDDDNDDNKWHQKHNKLKNKMTFFQNL